MNRKSWISGFLMIIFVLVGALFITPMTAEVKAAETVFKGEGFISEAMSINSYRGSNGEGHTAPKATSAEYKEWLFAGWYKEANCENPIGYKKTSGTYYAKFVPADTLSVKCQVADNTQGAESSKLRIVSTVDSLDYYQVGFEITAFVKGDNGTITQKTISYDSHEVAEKIKATDDGVNYNYTPNIFDVNSEYFTTVTITNILSENFDDAFYIKPYWVTRDNTKVFGESRYARVEDSYSNIVNVPIRVYSGENATAVTVAYNTENSFKNYTFVGAYGVNYGDENLEGYQVGDVPTGVTVAKGTGDQVIITPTDTNAIADGTLVNLRFSYTGTLTSATRFTVTENGATRKIVQRNLSVPFSGEASADATWYDADEDAFVITSAAELYGFSNKFKDTGFAGKTVYLGADIVVNPDTWNAKAKAVDGTTPSVETPTYIWTPLSWTSKNNIYGIFSGTFDGKGHTISGLYVKENMYAVGLFGRVEGATIKDFKVKNSYFESTSTEAGHIGGVIGYGYGSFSDIYSDAVVVSAKEFAGGIIGSVLSNSATITNCWFAGEIHSKSDYIGGVVGHANASGKTLIIKSCLNSGMLSTTSNGNVNHGHAMGGICGRSIMSLSIEDCLNTGKVMSGGVCCGSIIGLWTGSFSANSAYATVESWTGTVSGTTDKPGEGSITRINQNDLLDIYGYFNTTLSFYDEETNPTGAWAVVADSTPQLRALAESRVLNVTGVTRTNDVAWYVGHENDTSYTISTVAELRGMAELLKTTTNFAGKTIYLGQDISFNHGNASDWEIEAPVNKWIPMGWTSIHQEYKQFAGTFDGQGHEISGLYVKQELQGIGLFGYMAGATIKNLKITNSYFESSIASGPTYVGSVAGIGYGTMENIYSDAIVINNGQMTGGLLGYLAGNGAGTFTKCWFDGEVHLKGVNALEGGGFIGRVAKQCTLTDCLVSGTIDCEAEGEISLGGFVGYLNGQKFILNNCLGTIKVNPKGTSTSKVGSILGNDVSGATYCNNAYITKESYGNGNYGPFTPNGTKVDNFNELELYGNSAMTQLTGFNFTDMWEVVKGNTPILKGLHTGVTREIDVDWYIGKEDATEYTISTYAELNGMAELLKTTTDFAGKTIYLGEDIVLNDGDASDWATEAPDKEWTPMGWTATHTEYKQFAGTLDGQGHSISGLYVKEELSGVGLFGYIANAKIQNLKITNSYFESTINSSWVYMGSVAGIGYGIFTNVYSDAILVNGGEMTGGLIGRVVTANNTAFTKCWFDGEIHLKGDNGKVGGGFVGSLEKDAGLTDCLMSGTIDCEATGEVNVGGLIGKRTSSNLWLTRTMVTGHVIPKGASYSKVGALVGNSSASVFCDYAVFTNESYSGGMGDFTVTGPGQLPLSEIELYGQSAVTKLGTQFDFTNTWQTVEGNVPIIKGLHEGETREISTSWYIGHESDTTYTISTLADLMGMSELMKSKTDFSGKTIYLGADIVLNDGDASDWATEAPDKEWTPMGWTATHTEYKQFAGTLDGQGHEISGLYVKEELSGIGLFGYIANATIKNLKIVNSYFESTINSNWVYMGSVAGIGYGTFTNVYSDAILVNRGEMTGGFLGRVVTNNNTAFTQCWFDGEIHLKGDNGKVGGGFVGSLEKDAGLTNCLMSGTIDCEASGEVSVGGLVGKRTSSNLWLTTTMVTGDVLPKATSCTKVGALVGNSSASVYCDYAVFTNESYSGGMGSFSVNGPGQVPVSEVELYGTLAKNKFINQFDFANIWQTVEGSTPILKGLRGNTSWYKESNNTFTIDSVSDLYGLAELSQSITFEGKTINLGSDITLNEGTANDWDVLPPKNVWIPIGPASVRFKGTFDGQGHSISGLYATTGSDSGYHVGLFGYVEGTIKNLEILNSRFESTGSGTWLAVASVAGCGAGTFENIYSDAILENSGLYTGGMIGRLLTSGTVQNCWYDGQISLNGDEAYRGAGIIGSVEGGCTITNCLNSGVITATRNTSMAMHLAGLVGSVNSTLNISNSLNVGSVSGGHCTLGYGSVLGCHNSGTITISSTYATQESCSAVGHGMSSWTNVTVINKANLYGDSATTVLLGLDFTNTWQTVDKSTPILKQSTLKRERKQALVLSEMKKIAGSIDGATISGLDNYMLVENDTDGLAYNGLVNSLVSNGYTLYANNDAATEISAYVKTSTYTKGNVSFTVTRMVNKNKTYLVGSEDASLSPYLHYDDSYVAGNIAGKNTTLHNLEVADFGTSIVIQLKNGHFIVNDGGLSTLEDGKADIERLLTYMEELSGGEKPIVDAWIFSHLHSDHVGTTRDLVTNKTYRDRVYVNGMYYSEPNAEVFELDPGTWADRDYFMMAANCLLTSSGGHPEMYRMQTGQRYYFNDITMDIVLATEQLSISEYANVVYPNDDSKDNFNDSSVWCMFNIGGKKVLVTGDGEKGSMDYVMSAYSQDYLDVTAFTTPHHGHEPYQTFVDYMVPEQSTGKYLIVTNKRLNTRALLELSNILPGEKISEEDLKKHEANDVLEERIGSSNVYAWEDGANIFEFTGTGVNISRAGKYTFTTSQ